MPWYISLGVLAGIFVIVCVLVGIIKWRETARYALWCGALLALVALAASLYVPLWLPQGTSHDQAQYVVNAFLVLAALGASFMVAALCINLKPDPKPLSSKAPEPERCGASERLPEPSAKVRLRFSIELEIDPNNAQQVKEPAQAKAVAAVVAKPEP